MARTEKGRGTLRFLSVTLDMNQIKPNAMRPSIKFVLFVQLSCTAPPYIKNDSDTWVLHQALCLEGLPFVRLLHAHITFPPIRESCVFAVELMICIPGAEFQPLTCPYTLDAHFTDFLEGMVITE